MKLITQRKSQLRLVAKTGKYASLVATLWEAHFNPIDEFEKKFAEAYLMRLARLGNNAPGVNFHEEDSDTDKDIDPFAD